MDVLASPDGLANITSVGDKLFIYGNDCLSQTEADEFATGILVGGGMYDNGADYPCN